MRCSEFDVDVTCVCLCLEMEIEVEVYASGIVVETLGSHPRGCEFRAQQVQVYSHPKKKNTKLAHLTFSIPSC